ncbi:MAG: peptidylprolyl isomerase [Flavobacteriaceae bacterium]|nr:peptidylprolyl isomerase [Flavobacteriaceae bacterium]
MKIRLAYFLTFISLTLIGPSVFSQKKRDILFKIDKQPQLVSDFLKNYTKNIDIVADSSQKKISNYLDLFIDYKLKVKEAHFLGLDTLITFKGELSRYKQQLMTPYLKDSTVVKKLVEEAYYRTKYEVNVSHILIKLDENALPKDTLVAYKTISKARKAIVDGSDFSEVARQYSQDPSVNRNNGNIGYFRAFQMVYPFENAAYNTKIGDLSKPFRTRYGYHILKVKDKRLSQGEVEVAHIMLKYNDSLSSLNAKLKIDSLYKILESGGDFSELAKKFSQDSSSASKGGKLPKFSIGKMIQPFADEAFSLDSTNAYSKPFKTRFGWHIVKLIKRFPVPSLDKIKSELLKSVKRGNRSLKIEESIINRLLTTYNITEYPSALADFSKKEWHIKSDSLKKPLLKVEDSTFTQHDFVVYLKFKHITTPAPYKLYKQFKGRKVLDYYKSKLAITNPDYAASVNDFKEGLLLFDVMQEKVWEKAKKDSLGLRAYYMLNRSKYPKDFEKNKGIIISDYQDFLEREWLVTLRKKYPLEINKKALKKLIKKYN